MGKRLEFLKALKFELEQDRIQFEDHVEIGNKHTDCPADKARQKVGLESFPCKCPFDTRKEFNLYGCFYHCAIFRGQVGKQKVYSPSQMKNFTNHVKKLIG